MPSGHRWLFYKRPEHHGKRKPTDRHWEKAEVLLEGTTTAEAHLTVRPARPRRWRRGGREATIPLRDLHGMGRSLLDRDEALAFEGQDRRAGVEFRYGNIAWFVRGPPHVKNPKVWTFAARDDEAAESWLDLLRSVAHLTAIPASDAVLQGEPTVRPVSGLRQHLKPDNDEEEPAAAAACGGPGLGASSYLSEESSGTSLASGATTPRSLSPVRNAGGPAASCSSAAARAVPLMSPVLQTAGRGHAQWLEVPYYSPRGHTAPSPPSPQHLPGRGRSAFSRLSDYSHSSLASLRPHVSSADPVCTPARAGRGLRSPPVVMERRFSTLSISNSMNRLGSVVSSGRGTPLSTVGVRPLLRRYSSGFATSAHSDEFTSPPVAYTPLADDSIATQKTTYM